MGPANTISAGGVYLGFCFWNPTMGTQGFAGAPIFLMVMVAVLDDYKADENMVKHQDHVQELFDTFAPKTIATILEKNIGAWLCYGGS